MFEKFSSVLPVLPQAHPQKHFYSEENIMLHSHSLKEDSMTIEVTVIK